MDHTLISLSLISLSLISLTLISQFITYCPVRFLLGFICDTWNWLGYNSKHKVTAYILCCRHNDCSNAVHRCTRFSDHHSVQCHQNEEQKAPAGKPEINQRPPYNHFGALAGQRVGLFKATNGFERAFQTCPGLLPVYVG